MKLNPKKFGLAAGILWGTNIFVTTLFSVATGGYGKQFLGIMLGLYPGYSISVLGSVVGGVYAFVDFFVLFYVIAWLYNWLEKRK